MFNPFIGLLKAGYGTLAYRDAWNLFDNIVVSENLVTVPRAVTENPARPATRSSTAASSAVPT